MAQLEQWMIDSVNDVVRKHGAANLETISRGTERGISVGFTVWTQGTTSQFKVQAFHILDKPGKGEKGTADIDMPALLREIEDHLNYLMSGGPMIKLNYQE